MTPPPAFLHVFAACVLTALTALALAKLATIVFPAHPTCRGHDQYQQALYTTDTHGHHVLAAYVCGDGTILRP